jgi:hypothetical protein
MEVSVWLLCSRIYKHEDKAAYSYAGIHVSQNNVQDSMNGIVETNINMWRWIRKQTNQGKKYGMTMKLLWIIIHVRKIKEYRKENAQESSIFQVPKQTPHLNASLEFIMAVRAKTVDVWVVTRYSLVGESQQFTVSAYLACHLNVFLCV